MQQPDIEDLKAGQRHGQILKRPLSGRHSKAVAHLFRECAETSTQRQARIASAAEFWKMAFDSEDGTLIMDVAHDIAAGNIGEQELEIVLKSTGVPKSAILSPSLRERVFSAAFEFERHR